jgi:hypothetical protein
MGPNGGFGTRPRRPVQRVRPGAARGGSSGAFVPRGPWRPVQRRRVGAVAGLNAGGQRFAGDDGKPDPRVAAVLSAYAAGREGEHAALAALAGTRLLMPLVAFGQEHGGACGSPGASPAREACGSPGSSAAREMAFPTLIGRDGRPALLAFTSLDALTRWRADARPVPALAAQVW